LIQYVWAPTLFDTHTHTHSGEERRGEEGWLGHSLTFHLTDLRAEAAAPVVSAIATDISPQRLRRIHHKNTMQVRNLSYHFLTGTFKNVKNRRCGIKGTKNNV